MSFVPRVAETGATAAAIERAESMVRQIGCVQYKMGPIGLESAVVLRHWSTYNES